MQSLNHALQWAVPLWPSHTARINERTVCHSYMFTLYAFDFMWVHSKFSMCFYCETHGVKHLPFLRVLIPQCWGECNLPLSGHVSEPPDKCWEASLQSSWWQEQTHPQRLTHTLFTCRNTHGHNLFCNKSTSSMVWNMVCWLDESLFLQVPGEGTRGHSKVW